VLGPAGKLASTTRSTSARSGKTVAATILLWPSTSGAARLGAGVRKVTMTKEKTK
jgi:hypothetical protein